MNPIFDPLESLPLAQQALYWRLRRVQRAAWVILLFMVAYSILTKEPTTATITGAML